MKLKKFLIYSAVFIFVFSFILHEAYDYTKIPILAYISPINESIWEHVKLLSTPALLIGIVGSFVLKKYPNFTLGLAFGTILSILFMVSFVYIFDQYLGISNIIVHVIAFLLAILIMVYTTYTISTLPPINFSKSIGLLLLVGIVAGIAYLTYHPLDHYIFEEHEEKAFHQLF